METLQRFRGAQNLANIIDASLDALARIIADENAIRLLLYGGAD